MSSDYNRRDFLKAGAAAGMGLAAISQSAMAAPPACPEHMEYHDQPIHNVRIGFVGVWQKTDFKRLPA